MQTKGWWETSWGLLPHQQCFWDVVGSTTYFLLFKTRQIKILRIVLHTTKAVSYSEYLTDYLQLFYCFYIIAVLFIAHTVKLLPLSRNNNWYSLSAQHFQLKCRSAKELGMSKRKSFPKICHLQPKQESDVLSCFRSIQTKRKTSGSDNAGFTCLRGEVCDLNSESILCILMTWKHW